MLSATQAVVLLNSELKCWCLLLWNVLRVLCQLWPQGMVAPQHTGVCSQLHHFPCFAHSLRFFRLPCITWGKEEGANEILAPIFWFFLRILMKNLLSWSFLMQQSQIAWSCFCPRLWKLFQPPWTQFQIFIPQFCAKINWAALSSHFPNRQVSSCTRNIYLFRELDSLLYQCRDVLRRIFLPAVLHFWIQGYY